MDNRIINRNFWKWNLCYGNTRWKWSQGLTWSISSERQRPCLLLNCTKCVCFLLVELRSTFNGRGIVLESCFESNNRLVPRPFSAPCVDVVISFSFSSLLFSSPPWTRMTSSFPCSQWRHCPFTHIAWSHSLFFSCIDIFTLFVPLSLVSPRVDIYSVCRLKTNQKREENEVTITWYIHIQDTGRIPVPLYHWCRDPRRSS